MRTIFALTCALALASPSLAQNAPRVPQFQVDPFWPKPLPNNWILGQVSGIASRSLRPHLGGASPRLARPRASAPPSRTRREAKCCVAAPPVLVFDQSGNLIRPWGGPGQGYDWPQERARHLHRRQRFRLARRQRQDRRPAAQVHHGRQVRAADRQAGRQATTATRPSGSARRPTSRSMSPRKEVYRRRRLHQSPRRGVRFGDRRLQAPLGRLRQQAERRQDAALRSGQAGRRSSSAIRCTACASPRTAWSMSATAPTTACRSSARTAPSCPSISSRTQDAAQRLGLRDRVLARHGAEVHLHDRRHERRGAHRRSRHQRDARRASAGSAARPASSRRCTTSRSTAQGNIYTAEVKTGQRVQRFRRMDAQD